MKKLKIAFNYFMSCGLSSTFFKYRFETTACKIILPLSLFLCISLSDSVSTLFSLFLSLCITLSLFISVSYWLCLSVFLSLISCLSLSHIFSSCLSVFLFLYLCLSLLLSFSLPLSSLTIVSTLYCFQYISLSSSSTLSHFLAFSCFTHLLSFNHWVSYIFFPYLSMSLSPGLTIFSVLLSFYSTTIIIAIALLLLNPHELIFVLSFFFSHSNYHIHFCLQTSLLWLSIFLSIILVYYF